ncbi:hypothetical protein [Saccharothrix stipae]
MSGDSPDTTDTTPPPPPPDPPSSAGEAMVESAAEESSTSAETTSGAGDAMTSSADAGVEAQSTEPPDSGADAGAGSAMVEADEATTPVESETSTENENSPAEVDDNRQPPPSESDPSTPPPVSEAADPTTEDPVAEDPVAEDPVAEDPATEDPATEDPPVVNEDAANPPEANTPTEVEDDAPTAAATETETEDVAQRQEEDAQQQEDAEAQRQEEDAQQQEDAEAQRQEEDAQQQEDAEAQQQEEDTQQREADAKAEAEAKARAEAQEQAKAEEAQAKTEAEAASAAQAQAETEADAAAQAQPATEPETATGPDVHTEEPPSSADDDAADRAAADQGGEGDKPHEGALRADDQAFQDNYYMREGEPVRRDAYAQDADGNRIPQLRAGEDGWYVPVDSDVNRASFKGDVERYSANAEEKKTMQDVVDTRSDALAALDVAKKDPNTPEDALKDAYTAVRDIGEELGHRAGTLAVENVYGGEGVTITPLHEEGQRGPGRFDQIWRVSDQDGNDRFVVVECKGGDGPLGTRLDKGTPHEQGTPEYFASIERAMLKRPSEMSTAVDLITARNERNLDFILVRASTVESPQGAEFGGYSLRRFDLDRQGSNS